MSLELVLSLVAIVLSLVSLVTSFWVARSTASADVANGLNELLRAALANDESLVAFDGFFGDPRPDEHLDAKRHRVMGYHVLNTLEHVFRTRRRWLVDGSKPLLTTFLAEVLRNPAAQLALETGHYDERFVNYARNLMSSHESSSK